mgnify:CR=1 FL=1
MSGIKNAINRLGWRFGGNGNKNPFPVNEADINAYNNISDYIEQAEKKQFEANHLFAKMYIFIFMRVLENEKSTVYNNTARRRIGNILSMPIEQLVENLAESLNDTEWYDWLQNKNLEVKHPALRSEAEIKDVQNKIKENKIELTRMIKEPVWDLETVMPAIMSEVNNMINLYR